MTVTVSNSQVAGKQPCLAEFASDGFWFLEKMIYVTDGSRGAGHCAPRTLEFHGAVGVFIWELFSLLRSGCSDASLTIARTTGR